MVWELKRIKMNQRELTNPSLFHTASISKTNVVSCDKGVVVQSILFFDLQFTCSHVLFRTRWLVFSWFIVVQEGSSSHVLFFCIAWVTSPHQDHCLDRRQMNILSKRNFSSFTVGLWRILANYRLRYSGTSHILWEVLLREEWKHLPTIPFALSTCQSFNQGLQHFERTLSIFTRCAVDVISWIVLGFTPAQCWVSSLCKAGRLSEMPMMLETKTLRDSTSNASVQVVLISLNCAYSGWLVD